MKLGKIFFLVFVFFLINTQSSFAQQAFYGENGPTFYKNSVPVNSVVCGESITFDVPGVKPLDDGSRVVWLQQFRTNLLGDRSTIVKTFDGPFFLPMPEYRTKCGQDEGVFENTIFEVKKSGDTYVKAFSGLFAGYVKFLIGAPGEIRETTLEIDEFGIASLQVSRGHLAISSGFFYADGAIQDFLSKYSNDDMDEIIVVPMQSLISAVNKGSSMCDCAWRVRDPVSGIGTYLFNKLFPYNTSGRFFNVVQVPSLNNWVAGTTSTDEALWLLIHEIGHGWSAYYGDAYGMLDEFRAHWARTFSHDNSILGRGAGITDKGDGTFESGPGLVAERNFNDWDLYNMGLISADKVKDGFSVANSQQVAEFKYTGTRRNISLNSLIPSIGVRDPVQGFSYINQSNNIKITFLIVQGPNALDSELVVAKRKIQELIQPLSQRWSVATRNLSSLSVISPSSKVAKEKPHSILELFKQIITPVFAASASREQDLREIISDLDATFQKTHDHEVKNNQIDFESVNFDGDEKLRLAEQSAADTKLAPLTISQPRSAVGRLNQILARLLTLQTELLNLLKRRVELFGR